MPLEMNYKEVAACTETAFSLILGCRGVINHVPTASEGTGAHHREGDEKRTAEAARKHPRASVMFCLGCHSRLSGIFLLSLKIPDGPAWKIWKGI